MSPRPHNRRAFVLNSLTGNELQGGKRDITRVFHIFTDQDYGMCDPKRSELIPDCKGPTELIARLSDFLENWEENPRILLFYYSGHGITLSDRFYFKYGEKKRDLYPFASLIEEVAKFGVKTAAFILDACHSGAARSGGAKGESGRDERIPIPEDTPQGFTILTSCTKKEKSYEDESGSFGIFTELFCDCIESGFGRKATANNVICAQDIVTYVGNRLAAEYRDCPQTPTFEIRKGRGTLWIAKNNTKATDTGKAGKTAPDDLAGDHFLNRQTDEAGFDEKELRAYRQMLREDVREDTEEQTNPEFLQKMGFLKEGCLTLLGIYLFGRPGIRKRRSPETLCSVYGDSGGTAPEKGDYDGPVHRQIKDAHKFVLSNIEKRELMMSKEARLAEIHEYPPDCVRELIANALCHRDYTHTGRNVYVSIFKNPPRIEITNPGNWYAKKLQDNKVYSLPETRPASGEPRQRNPSLAKAMRNILLSEKRGEGIGRVIKGCQGSSCRIPTVIQRDDAVTVTIYPREDWGHVGGPAVSTFKDVVAVRRKTPRKRPAAGQDRKKTTKFNGRSLREVVSRNKICASLFKEAEALAKSIFKAEKYVPLPFYAEHGEGSCKAIEDNVNKIIWKNGDGVLDEKHDFIPSPEEAMYLLSAVWLHDIGMWYGILDNEEPDDLQEAARVIRLRDKHEVRTARYILEKWEKDCSWEPEEKDWLSNICVYHRGHYPMSTFEPFGTDGRYTKGEVRLRVLAALVRLADACHVDKTRAPQRVMNLYISLGMLAEARVHWERADLIRKVRFEHGNRSIELTGHYPREFPFGLGEFDVREVGEMICDNVRRELRSVQQTLSHFSNTDFGGVLHIPRQIRAQDYQQKQQCLHLWPYFLSRPFSATEAAAALAQMLLLSAEQAEESGNLGEGWREDMHQIMEKTKTWREQDFMIRNLCIDVEKLLSELPENTRSATKLTKYLKRFMKSIEDNCRRLVSHALKEIEPSDVLALYGHSINVEQLLRDIDTRHFLYIVDCYKPLRGHRVFDENEQIIQSVKDSGFGDKYKFLQLESLSAALGELKRKKVRCKLLLGTHGRLKGGDLLCKVGSYIIAEVAKRFGVEVIALCESTKFLSKSDSIKDREIAGPEQLFSSEDEKMHPELVDVPYIAPKMDRVPKELVDMVITEHGVERRRLQDIRERGRRR